MRTTNQRSAFGQFLVPVLVCVFSLSLDAATNTVTTLANSGPGSLPAVLASASNGDTIDFAVTGTIVLAHELQTSKNVIIDGPGTTNLTVDGNGVTRVFHICPSGSATIANLTISNGNGFGYSCGGGGTIMFSTSIPPRLGGGIFNEGTLTLDRCRIAGNSADEGGAIYNRGPCPNYSICLDPPGIGTLNVRNSTISNNSAANGGGIYNFNGNIVIIEDSTFSGNSAAEGGGMENRFDGYVFVIASTFNENAAGRGGAINNLGRYGVLQIISSTFSGNLAPTDFGGGIHNCGDLKLSCCTFSGNSALAGGSIYQSGSCTSGSVTSTEIGGTILNAGASGANIVISGGSFWSWGYNLSSDGGSGLLLGMGDQINTDPMLAPLADNGGPTPTHALLSGSPAIDQGISFGGTADQRGFPRPVADPCIADAGDGTDIGAYEVQQTCQPLEFRITSIKPDGSHLRLSYATVLGSNYVVQACSSLLDQSWTSLPGTNLGIGVVMQSVVSNALAAPQSFYRIQQLP
jgi:hypothetical protein